MNLSNRRPGPPAASAAVVGVTNGPAACPEALHLRRDAVQNRQRILAAAERIFIGQGLEASIDAVIAEAGVGTGTFYRRFPNKDALVDALMEHVTDRFIALGLQALREHGADGTALEQFLYAAGEHIERYQVLAERLWSRGSLASVGPQRMGAIEALLADIVLAARSHDQLDELVSAADVRDVLRALTGVVHANATAGDADWRRHLALVLTGMRPNARGSLKVPTSWKDAPMPKPGALP